MTLTVVVFVLVVDVLVVIVVVVVVDRNPVKTPMPAAWMKSLSSMKGRGSPWRSRSVCCSVSTVRRDRNRGEAASGLRSSRWPSTVWEGGCSS